MSLTLTAGVVSSTTPYSTSNGDFSYSVKNHKNDSSFTSLSGNITKTTTTTDSSGESVTSTANVGTLNKIGSGDVQLNLSSSLTTAEKQSIIADIDEIISQLTA